MGAAKSITKTKPPWLDVIDAMTISWYSGASIPGANMASPTSSVTTLVRDADARGAAMNVANINKIDTTRYLENLNISKSAPYFHIGQSVLKCSSPEAVSRPMGPKAKLVYAIQFFPSILGVGAEMPSPIPSKSRARCNPRYRSTATEFLQLCLEEQQPEILPNRLQQS